MEKIFLIIPHVITTVTLETRLGAEGVYWCEAVHLRALKDVAIGQSNSVLAGWADKVRWFLDGKLSNLNAIPLVFDRYTPFQHAVCNAARTIPRGTMISYAELARQSGYPKAIRAVASVMRNNRFPLIIPCHRVIRSDGTIGGFGGETTGRNISLKKRLLAMEGIKDFIVPNKKQATAEKGTA